MKKYLQLAAQIVRFGTLKGHGRNFRKSRARSLESLQEFVPQNVQAGSEAKADSDKQSSLNNLTGQLAFIRHAFKTKGGHLCASDLAYVRIPKAANTSISYAMLIKKYPSLAAKDPDETQINFLTDVNLKTVSETESETIFTVVRNPFARLVSVYRDFFENNDSDFLYADYLFGILKPEISFAEFVSRISRIPDRLKDQHFRPQHLFVQPYEKSGHAVKWFKLEEPETLGQFLREHDMKLV
ncbi:MAG TPA: sulfotransferase family 2 domain-containing protein, partial [Cyclobacteriaceae bacterium]|nr:sulfotransferase family 2 domain-containing protein [Cyclobacteriaceae bacterium]